MAGYTFHTAASVNLPYEGAGRRELLCARPWDRIYSPGLVSSFLAMAMIPGSSSKGLGKLGREGAPSNGT